MVLLTIVRWVQWSAREEPDRSSGMSEEGNSRNDRLDLDTSPLQTEDSESDLAIASSMQCNVEHDDGKGQTPVRIDDCKDDATNACISEFPSMEGSTSVEGNIPAPEAQHLRYQKVSSLCPDEDWNESCVIRSQSTRDCTLSSDEAQEDSRDETDGYSRGDGVGVSNEDHQDDRICRSAQNYPLLANSVNVFQIPELELFFLWPPIQEAPAIVDSIKECQVPLGEGSAVVVEEGRVDEEMVDSEAVVGATEVDAFLDHVSVQSYTASNLHHAQGDQESVLARQQESAEIQQEEEDFSAHECDAASISSGRNQAGGTSTSEIPRHLRFCRTQGDGEDDDRQVEQWARKYEDAHNVISSLRRDLEYSSTHILKLESEQQDNAERILLCQEELEWTRKEKESLHLKVKSIQRLLDEAISTKEQLESKYKADEVAQKSRMSNMEALVSRLERESENLSQQSEGYKASLLKQATTFEHENEKLRCQVKTLDVRLDDTIAGFRTQLRQAIVRANDLQFQLETCRSEYEVSQAERDELHSLAELAVAERDFAMRLVEDIEAKNNKLINEIESLRLNQKDDQSQIKMLKSKIAQKNLLLQASDRVLESMQNEGDCMTHLSNELDEVAYCEEVDLTGEWGAERMRMASRLHDLEQSIFKYQEPLKAAEARNAVVTHQLYEYEKNMVTLGDEMEAAYVGIGNKVESLTLQIDEANSRVVELEGELKLSDEEVKCLRAEKEELSQRVILIQREKEDLQASLKTAESMNNKLAHGLTVAQATALSSGRLVKALGSGNLDREARQRTIEKSLKSLHKQREDLVTKLTSTMEKNIVSVASDDSSLSMEQKAGRKDLSTLLLEAENDLKVSCMCGKFAGREASASLKSKNVFEEIGDRKLRNLSNEDCSPQVGNGMSTTTEYVRGELANRVRHFPTRVSGKDATYCGSVIQVEGKTILHGNGALRFKDGDLYLGEMEAGLMHGYGTLYPKRGTVLRGRFEKNAFQCGTKMDG